MLRLEFDQAAVSVNRGLCSRVGLRARLLVTGLGVLNLHALRFDQRIRRHQLQIGPGDGEDDLFPCMTGVKVGGIRRLPGGTIVVERGEIHQALLQRSAHVVIVERARSGRKIEAGDAREESRVEALDGQIDLRGIL